MISKVCIRNNLVMYCKCAYNSIDILLRHFSNPINFLILPLLPITKRSQIGCIESKPIIFIYTFNQSYKTSSFLITQSHQKVFEIETRSMYIKLPSVLKYHNLLETNSVSFIYVNTAFIIITMYFYYGYSVYSEFSLYSMRNKNIFHLEYKATRISVNYDSFSFHIQYLDFT